MKRLETHGPFLWKQKLFRGRHLVEFFSLDSLKPSPAPLPRGKQSGRFPSSEKPIDLPSATGARGGIQVLQKLSPMDCVGMTA
ncbi:MAG: hypothetical protein ACUVV5_12500, partial [Candidatus Aminicenantales bacterium]